MKEDDKEARRLRRYRRRSDCDSFRELVQKMNNEISSEYYDNGSIDVGSSSNCVNGHVISAAAPLPFPGVTKSSTVNNFSTKYNADTQNFNNNSKEIPLSSVKTLNSVPFSPYSSNNNHNGTKYSSCATSTARMIANGPTSSLNTISCIKGRSLSPLTVKDLDNNEVKQGAIADNIKPTPPSYVPRRPLLPTR